jgi:hypothetical protein
MCRRVRSYHRAAIISFANSFVSCGDSDYVPLVNLLGIYFQIRDDYCNLRSKNVGSCYYFLSMAIDTLYENVSMPPIKGTLRISQKENFRFLSSTA